MSTHEDELAIAKGLINKIKTMKRGDSNSPHKYIMLLSIISLIDENVDRKNRFTFNELEPVFLFHFNQYFKSMPEHTKMLEYPYYHLQNEGIWFLKIHLNNEDKYYKYKQMRLTKKRLLETVEYGYLDEDIYNLLKKSEIRSYLNFEIMKKLNQDKENIGYECYEYKEVEKATMFFMEEKSLFEHEQSAIEIIKSAIANNKYGQVVDNLLLYDKQSNNYLEFDILLVTTWGIFAIELKHWSGHIRIAPYNWVINDTSYRNDPHKINNYKSKVLKGIYQHEFRMYPNVYVQSVVILTNPEATVEGNTSPKAAIEEISGSPTFASIQDFITYLKKCSDVRNKIFTDQQVNNITNYFRSLNQPKRDIKYNVPGYETLEYISQKQDCIELIGRSIESNVNGLIRFRIYRPPLNVTLSERESFKKRAYNTINTVSQIGEHPNILKVWVMKNEEGDIIEGSEWSETGTLRDILNNRNDTFNIQKYLEICRSIVSALIKSHDAGVIHRNLRPENILMFNNIPKLINFDLAYQIEDNRITVISDVSKLKDDGYIAPEVLSGKDIDEATDYFNFGIIAYEIFTGQKAFASTRSFIAQGGLLSGDALRKLTTSNAPEGVISAIQQLLVAQRDQRLKNPQKIMASFGFEDEEKQMLTTNLGNRELMPNERYDLFEIIELIGYGGEAQIYKATWKEKIVALKLFNKEVSRDKIFREYRIATAIQSSYTVHCENLGYWKNDRYFLVLDYLAGESLRNHIEKNIKPDYGVFLKVAHGLMDAVKALHNYHIDEDTLKPYLHSDIKPDNIIILSDGKPVLIDFGIAGEPRVDAFQGTSDYVPPDSIIGADMKFSQDGDLYALGVTLWEWLFGSKPYINPIIGAKPILPDEISIELPEHIKSWLLKAVATDVNQRFNTIEDMEQAFVQKSEEEIVLFQAEESFIQRSEEGMSLARVEGGTAMLNRDAEVSIERSLWSENGNKFVTYLNTLSNISAGNENATAESQILNEYFLKIAVRHPLTDSIFETLISEKRNVILTGNAGDGKTTIASQIRERIRADRCPLPPIEELPEQNVIIIKDMSELNTSRRVDILKQSINDNDNSYLIVSNTGTLLDSFNELAKLKPAVNQSTILKALSNDKPTEIIGGKFVVINIGSINSINTACEVFKRMIAKENWTDCSVCSIADVCPLYFNVALLQSKEEVVVNRIALIYRRLYEYNVRLTMRQMVGHLAFAITAGHNCTDVASKSIIELKMTTSKFLFFNLFFGDDGKETAFVASQLLPVIKIQEAGFGAFLDPLFERDVWILTDFNAMNQAYFSEDFANKLSYLFKQTEHSSRRQLRRLIYFYGTLDDEKGKQFISVFLRSPMLQKYIELVSKNKKLPVMDERKYRLRILQVFQELITGIHLPESKWQAKSDVLYITVNRAGFASGTQIVLADFRLADFELGVKTKYQLADERNNILTLCYLNSAICLELDLPFIDYVTRRYEGEIAEELSPYYADRLNKFKVNLLKESKRYIDENELNLLIVSDDRVLKKMKMSFVENKLEVLL